jgi:phosphocarrier protein
MAASKDIPIINKLGLHARAAAKLVHTASRYASDIKLKKGGEEVDAKSILGILLLAAGKGSTVTITASGSDESEALDSIEQLFLNRFDEVE